MAPLVRWSPASVVNQRTSSVCCFFARAAVSPPSLESLSPRRPFSRHNATCEAAASAQTAAATSVGCVTQKRRARAACTVPEKRGEEEREEEAEEEEREERGEGEEEEEGDEEEREDEKEGEEEGRSVRQGTSVGVRRREEEYRE
ncbi:hypothetical protein TGFOU_404790 [Toxoplasma gondii FOU]|uniref:Uncharacterized protein n=1 Tax=Toxoplasma gondii FOU TaxID=943167 RepID=A0A086KUP1_TOXGO|nr:hypothetical protein TGFOU_404790 [Toxoplasma gondii FOU]